MLRYVRIATLLTLCIVLVSSAATELIILWLLSYPAALSHLPHGFHHFVRGIYISERHNPITTDGHYVYDSEITYKLAPGRFSLNNTEYSTDYSVNSMNVRDSEEALLGPEIAALGDSFTMGFGVDQGATYPAILGRTTGMRTLNLGITSFATVREVRLLQRFDLRNLKVVLVQYCANDMLENETFAANPAGFATMSQRDFEAKVARHNAERGYYPFKYSNALVRTLSNQLRSSSPVNDDRAAATIEARAFLTALTRASTVDFTARHVIVFELNPNGIQRPLVLEQIRLQAESPEIRAAVPNLHVVELGKFDRQDLFLLDDHLTANGNAKVARQLAAKLAELKLSPAPVR